MSDDTRKDGVVCDQYSQRINCRAEITETSVSFSGLRTAVMAKIPVGGIARLGAGGFGVHWVNLYTCSGNDPPQNDPYCGMQPMKEIELGLAFRF
jgi:hypothetical protein